MGREPEDPTNMNNRTHEEVWIIYGLFLSNLKTSEDTNVVNLARRPTI